MLLDISSGPVPGDPYATPTPERSFTSSVNEEPSEPRIALWTKGFADEPIASDCAAASVAAAKKFEELGCRVEEARPDFDAAGLRGAFDVLFTANIRNVVNAKTAHPRVSSDAPLFEPVVIDCCEKGAAYSASDYASAVQLTHQTARCLGEFFKDYDLLVTPTLANPPLLLGTLDMQSNDWPTFITALLDEIPFTPLFNATGCPAASVPMGRSTEGLPVGVHIGAPLGHEDSIFRLVGALERQWPWHALNQN